MRGLRAHMTLLDVAYQLWGSALSFAGSAGGLTEESHIVRKSVELRAQGGLR